MKGWYEMSKAQEYVAEELTRIMHAEGSGYRTGALLLTYPSTKPGATCQIAMGAGLAKAAAEHTLDLFQLVKGLRRLADELEARLEGKVPLGQEITGDEIR